MKPSKGPHNHDWFPPHYLSQSSPTHVYALIPSPAPRVVPSCHLCPDFFFLIRIHTTRISHSYSYSYKQESLDQESARVLRVARPRSNKRASPSSRVASDRACRCLCQSSPPNGKLAHSTTFTGNDTSRRLDSNLLRNDCAKRWAR